MKRISDYWIPCVMGVLVILLIAFLVLLQSDGKISDTSIEDVSAAATDSLDMSAMQVADSNMIKRLYGLNPSEYEGIVLYYPVTNMDAQELLIVRMKDTSQQDTVAASIESRLTAQKNSFEGYGVEQFELLSNSITEISGNYAFFIVHPDAKTVLANIRKVL